LLDLDFELRSPPPDYSEKLVKTQTMGEKCSLPGAGADLIGGAFWAKGVNLARNWYEKHSSLS
jgi:hypothetical protein